MCGCIAKRVNVDLDYLFSSYELADRFLDIVELRQMPCKITRYARVRIVNDNPRPSREKEG